MSGFEESYNCAIHPLHQSRYSIIRRRVAWFIGKWIREDCAPANDRRIWEVLVHLLQYGQTSGTEMAVRLTAASALRMCIEVSVVVTPDVYGNVLSCFH